MTKALAPTPQDHHKIPLSVFIIAQDEADRIVKVIESVVDWVDEVIVIDSGSKDDTVQVSKKAGARVIYNPWPGYGQQKRFGEEQCRNSWVLNLDADEVLSDEVKDDIQELFRDAPPKSTYGYRLNIYTVVPHAPHRHRGLPKFSPVRLYNTSYGRYSPHYVHDRVEIKDDYVEHKPLKGYVHHYSIRNISHLISKLNSYSDQQIKTFKSRSKLSLGLRLIIEFPFNFIRYYFFRRLFLSGMYGFIMAMIYAFFRFEKIAKAYERELNQTLETSDK